jgi:hypothetical protein
MMNIILLSSICVTTLPCLAVLLQHGTVGIWKAEEQSGCIFNSPGRINPHAVINHALNSSNYLMSCFTIDHARRITMGEAGFM